MESIQYGIEMENSTNLMNGNMCEERNLFKRESFGLEHSILLESGKFKKVRKKDKTPIKEGTRKSVRSRKTPVVLSESVTDPHAIGESIQKRILQTAAMRSQQQQQQQPQQSVQPKIISKPKQAPRQNLYVNFKCDHCGSRYVVNPMRRGNKVSASKYKAAPRHKIDPDTQKILTLCNACGLKFGRQKKDRLNKEELSKDEQHNFYEEGERFARDLSLKLDNEEASRLFCAHVKKTACGCIQKYIRESEANVDEYLARGKMLLELLVKASELKKQKCYDVNSLDTKPGKKSTPKIGLGNGHRKSKEFEEFVLTERNYLRNILNFCEKATQKILSYSNNFLHKRMKTDPQKGIRVERQKGKAALGMLKLIQDLPLEACCVDNCVRMALTHGRLLEVWRERATSSQVEARRVLAEMLTPSGGNRANCYRFISWVTGCSNTTIGKVGEQMKNTGGDREPPEHGLKKYWKDNPKTKKLKISQTTFVPSYQILQTAANSAGLSTMMQDLAEKTNEPHAKRMKRQSNKQAKAESKLKKIDFTSHNRMQNALNIVTDSNVNIVTDNNEQVATNLQNISAAVIAVNGNYQNGGFISIPAGLTAGNAITIPNGVSLQAAQQQLHQQQIQLQIQLLQQQLQANQNVGLAQQAVQQTGDSTEYMVTGSNPLEQTNTVQSVGTPVVMQTVTTQPVVQNVVTQSIVPNVVSEAVLPTIVAAHSSGGINFVSSGGNMNILQQQHNEASRNTQGISLLASPITNAGEISIIAQNNAVSLLTPQATNLTNNPALGSRVARSIENYRQVHLITSQSPTMAITQPVAISLQTPTISLSNLPTMLLAQSTAAEHQQQRLIIHPTSTSQQGQEQLMFQRPLSTQTNADHLVVQQAMPTVQSNREQTITSSVLPPMTSFNADAFLTNEGTTTYAVINNGTLSQIHPRQLLDDQERHLEQTNTIQVPFLQP